MLATKFKHFFVVALTIVYVILLLIAFICIQEVRKGTFHLTPLGEAALGRHVEVVKLLLAKGADYTFKAGVSKKAMHSSLLELH